MDVYLEIGELQRRLNAEADKALRTALLRAGEEAAERMQLEAVGWIEVPASYQGREVRVKLWGPNLMQRVAEGVFQYRRDGNREAHVADFVAKVKALEGVDGD